VVYTYRYKIFHAKDAYLQGVGYVQSGKHSSKRTAYSLRYRKYIKGGCVTQIKIILTVLAILIICGLLLYVQSLKAANNTLTTDLQQSLANTEVLEASLMANTAALQVREMEVAKLTQQTNEILEGLDEVYKTDKVASDWASTELPASVLRLLK